MSDPLAGAEGLLAEAKTITDEWLGELGAQLRTEVPGPLGDGLAYALGTSGKRVRPALVLASYRTAGGAAAGIAGIAAAVEIVHTYSLVHDDLPCMDDDAQRRGRPTTHIRFGVPVATRVGYLLVPAALEVLCRACRELGLSTETLGRIATVLLEASGIRGMVGGQWLDLKAEGQCLDVAALREVHGRKTGALIEAACLIGALAAGAPAPLAEALRRFGAGIGLAFQVADDVLDATATTAQLGKTAGRDATLAKSTYVSLMGIEAARREADRLVDESLAQLARAGVHAPSLDALAGYIVKRQS
jgi:geranylgeranyl pyrophosphate synthase